MDYLIRFATTPHFFVECEDNIKCFSLNDIFNDYNLNRVYHRMRERNIEELVEDNCSYRIELELLA